MPYKDLRSYQTTVIIYDFTEEFCRRYLDKRSRTVEQMTHAARSGKQNIVEASEERTSKKAELKLLGVSRASLKELQEDYKDYLRQHKLELWDKDDQRAQEIRRLAYVGNRSYETYASYMSHPETACNCAICLINQATYLLDRQIAALERKFVEEGGYTEQLFRKRVEERNRQASQPRKTTGPPHRPAPADSLPQTTGPQSSDRTQRSHGTYPPPAKPADHKTYGSYGTHGTHRTYGSHRTYPPPAKPPDRTKPATADERNIITPDRSRPDENTQPHN